MQYINIIVNKERATKIKDNEIRAQVFRACLDHLPVEFNDPKSAEKASKLFYVTLTDGSRAYRLKVPVFGTYYTTEWYRHTEAVNA